MSGGGRFKEQCYEKLVKHHRELGVPWTDPAFPPSDASVGAAKVRQLGRKVESRVEEALRECRVGRRGWRVTT